MGKRRKGTRRAGRTPVKTFQPEDWHERRESFPPFQVHIVSYRIDGTYFCTVDNVDPGAVIARAKGSTQEEAEEKAVFRAQQRLGRTRIVGEKPTDIERDAE